MTVVVTALGVAGCSLPHGDAVHDEWVKRSALPSCGEVSLATGEGLQESGKVEVACLQEALATGRGAELLVRFSTVEGDPITEYHRVVPGGGMEVYVDSTKDKFGSQRWEFSHCAAPASALDVNC